MSERLRFALVSGCVAVALVVAPAALAPLADELRGPYADPPRELDARAPELTPARHPLALRTDERLRLASAGR
jgi:hypothetical protein